MSPKVSLRQLAGWSLPLALMGGIFFMSSRPAPEILHRFYFDMQDKILHTFAYLVLASSFLRALLASGYPLTRKVILIAIACSALYGATDEFHQSFVPSRSSDIDDWFADLFGSSLLWFAGKPLSGFFLRELSLYGPAPEEAQG